MQLRRNEAQRAPRIVTAAALALLCIASALCECAAAHESPLLALNVDEEGAPCVSGSKDRDPLPNTVPRYGTSSMDEYKARRGACRKEVDDRFIADMSREFNGDMDRALAAVLALGWSAMQRGDAAIAMRRFNQAWLINPESAGAYWGFGAASFGKQDAEKALEMFDQAATMIIQNGSMPTIERSRFYCDFGRTYLMATKHMSLSEPKFRLYLERANDLFRQSKQAHPNSGCCTYRWWVHTLIMLNKYELAWEKVHLAQKEEGQCEMPTSLLLLLRTAMPEPKH